ncbi:cytochrome b561 and DOMON domain-containing protein At3g61750 [Mercurialis annua]|uniref:cytochrome b561 and DOMON domain-containing protein At3g61750 n=1 Tax=Mercurialis annua TaxID=3986 RepID=UPI00215FF0C2|nr:cytochrome b561 and DOMON domain-containing protein At3g61750 [Mercurialis annua]
MIITRHHSSFRCKQATNSSQPPHSHIIFSSSLTSSHFLILYSLLHNSTFQALMDTSTLLVSLCFLSHFLIPNKIYVAALHTYQHNDDAVANVEEQQSSQNAAVDRSELCNTDMSTFLPPPYNNISNMACSPIWNNFLLRYHKREGNLVTFIVSAEYTSGWVGMGFSRNGMMTGSSAMVGWFTKQGHAQIKQYYLQGPRSSQVIADAGEIDLTKVPPAVVLHGPMIYLAFQARFEKPLTRQPILLAFGTEYPRNHRLSIHDDKTTILFDFHAGSASQHINPGVMMKNHGILGIFAWTLLLPVGAIIARYLRHKDPLWYYLHAGFQFVGFLFALATVVLGQQLYSKINADLPAHRSIGILVLTLSVLQILAFFLRPKRDAKIRKYWNWYHSWFGRIALFFGALNVLLGIQAGGGAIAWKICYGFLISTVILMVIILEILSRVRKSETTPFSSFQMNSIPIP